MTEKTRKVLGWICLAYSGVHSLLYILTIAVPTAARIAYRSWIDHLVTLWLIYLSFSLGRSLLRGKLEGNRLVWFLNCIFLFFPLIVIQQASRLGQPAGVVVWISWFRFFYLVIGTGCVIIPYLFEGQILRQLASRGPGRLTTPAQGLGIIGMGCSVMPSAVGGNLILLGIEKQTVCIYYLVGISYVAIAVWWVWWNNRYSGKSKAV